jgi:hypothetical protein
MSRSEAKKIFERRRNHFPKVLIHFLLKPAAALGLIFIAFVMTACSSLPEIKPPGPGLQPILLEWCQSIFPDAPHQFVHAIEARLPDDSRATAMGIVTLDPARGIIQCVIMTIEGFVLFDARYQQAVTVNRAVYPFDSPEFAESMMADIRLVFFPPGKALVTAGVLDKGFPGCRWQTADGLAVDVLLNQRLGWVIRQYDTSDHISRQVRAYALNPEGIPEKIELSHYKFPSYTLKMTLLQVERLPQGDGRLN